MKKTFVIGLLLLSFDSNFLVAQQLDKDKIYNEILKRFPSAQLDDKTLYVLNGIPVQNESLDSEISVVKKSDLCGLQYLNSSMVKENTFLRPGASVVIITTKEKIYRKSQKEEFKRITELYQVEQETSGLPALTINGELIQPDRSKEIINNLKRKKTECINIIDYPVSTDYFGENGKNGLVELQTKKRKPVPNNGEHEEPL